jgi:aspartokinase
MADTIRIGGIKLSGELVQIDFREPVTPGGRLTEVLQQISSAKINLPHLHQGLVGDDMQTTFCIEIHDYHRLQSILNTEFGDLWFRILPSVGTVSLFPHGSSLGFVAAVYAIFTKEGIAVHGMSSSVSAFVIHTDYSEIDRVVTALLKVYELPKNHSPLRSELRMQQVER